MSIDYSLPPLCIGNFAWEELIIDRNILGVYPGGMGLRFVLAFSYYGLPCSYITAIGKEKKWHPILKKLQDNKICQLKMAKYNQSLYFKWNYSKDKKLLTLDIQNGKIMDIIPNLVTDNILLKDFSLVNVCSLGYKNEVKIIDHLKNKNAIISYIFHSSNLISSSKKDYLNLFKNIDYLFLNDKESAMLVGGHDTYNDGVYLSKISKTVYITRNSKSVLIFERGRLLYEVNPYKVQIVDDSGAGDMFAAGTVLGLLVTHGDIKAACRFGISTACLSLNDYFSNKYLEML